MNLSVTGLPALAIAVGFIVVFSAPVWLAAKVIGAAHPTLLRAALALLVGSIGAVTGAAVFGAAVLLLAPLSFLLSIKYILGTSFPGAVIVAMLAAAGYVALVHFVGGGLSATGTAISV